MCEPATIALMATVASTAANTYGSFQQAKAQKAAMQAEAAATDRERISADERATDQAQQIGTQVATARGRQQLAQAGSGIDMGFGSAAGAQDATDYYGLQDQAVAARNASDVDYNYRNRASQLRSGASQVRPWMAAGGSLLSGAGKVASTWYNFGGTSGAKK